jgi:hypothetical protein
MVSFSLMELERLEMALARQPLGRESSKPILLAMMMHQQPVRCRLLRAE